MVPYSKSCSGSFFLITEKVCLILFHDYRFYLKLSKMLVKKKQTLLPSKNQQSNSKLTIDNKNSSRKSFQKHSRKGTKDYQPFNLQVLINCKFLASARESAHRSLLFNINSLFFGYSCPFSLQLKEALTISSASEQLNNYYILSKHRNEHTGGKRLIETSLVEAIQSKSQVQFLPKAIMHFHNNLYPIMYQHMARRKNYYKKINNFQTYSSINRDPKPWTKELPTLVSDRDHDDSDLQFYRDQVGKESDRRLNTSESFELKKLTDCIKEMFTKQTAFDNRKVSMIDWGKDQESWLAAGKSLEKRPLLECDFSSIQSHSKNDLQIDSKVKDKWCNDAEQNYGLGSLRRKYEEQRLSRLKQSEGTESKIILGHKRNPTETLHNREHLFEEPMTPKENCRSVFASAQNIMPNSPKHLKAKSKKKDVQVNEAYLLRFEKKKPSTILNLKQNIHKQKSKLKTQVSNSKSRSKQKMKCMLKKK